MGEAGEAQQEEGEAKGRNRAMKMQSGVHLPSSVTTRGAPGCSSEVQTAPAGAQGGVEVVRKRARKPKRVGGKVDGGNVEVDDPSLMEVTVLPRASGDKRRHLPGDDEEGRRSRAKGLSFSGLSTTDVAESGLDLVSSGSVVGPSLHLSTEVSQDQVVGLIRWSCVLWAGVCPFISGAL